MLCWNIREIDIRIFSLRCCSASPLNTHISAQFGLHHTVRKELAFWWMNIFKFVANIRAFAISTKGESSHNYNRGCVEFHGTLSIITARNSKCNLGRIYWYGLTEIALISDCIQIFPRDVLTQTCLLSTWFNQTSVGVNACISNYILHFYVDVTTYPCPDHNIGLANLC